MATTVDVENPLRGKSVDVKNMKSVHSKSKTPPSSGIVVVAKSKDWSVYLDRKTGNRFYRNEKTGLDQRNMPAIGWIQNMKSSKSAGGKPNPNAHNNMTVRRPSPPSITP